MVSTILTLVRDYTVKLSLTYKPFVSLIRDCKTFLDLKPTVLRTFLDQFIRQPFPNLMNAVQVTSIKRDERFVPGAIFDLETFRSGLS